MRTKLAFREFAFFCFFLLGAVGILNEACSRFARWEVSQEGHRVLSSRQFHAVVRVAKGERAIRM